MDYTFPRMTALSNRRTFTLKASALLIIMLWLAACSPAAEPTAVPTETPTLLPTATDLPAPAPSETPEPLQSPTPTETLIPVTAEPLLGELTEPPLNITLPPDWSRVLADRLLVQDVDNTLRWIPVTVYSGPVTGGLGFIVLLWGFPNLTSITPENPDIQQIMWLEGLRLFRRALVEEGCNPGTDLQTAFTIGDRAASGTRFAIVDCAETADARGWFAGLQEGGGNFVFFNYIEPAGDINAQETIAAMNAGEGELQAILDTVQFRVSEQIAPAATP